MSHRLLILALLALAASSPLASPLASTPSAAADEGGGPAAPVTAPARGPRASSLRLRLADGRELSISDDRFAKEPLAIVDGRAITLWELRAAAAALHPDRAEGKGKDGKAPKSSKPFGMDVRALLDRLIGLRLIEAEARTMGLDGLDDVKLAIQENRDRIRLDLIRARAIKGVEADRGELERRYAEAAREWKLRSVLFTKQEDAVAFGAALAGGGDFEKLTALGVAEKKARSEGGAQWVRASRLLPDVTRAVSALAPRGETAPIRVPEGWTVVRLEEARVARDPGLRAQVEAAVRDDKAKEALKSYYDGLKKKHVQIDEAQLKAVDFDSPTPGFDALKKDGRVVARIAGDPQPITIGDLAEELARPLFHGVESAQKEKRVDKQKEQALDALVSRRLVVLESARYRIDALPEAKARQAEFESNMLFTTFVDRVILPEVEVTQDALRAEYEKRKGELAYPAFYRLEGLAFADAKQAQAALKNLQTGTDFGWLKNSADGLVQPDKRAPAFDGSTVSANSLPADLRRALTGAREGDVRPYAAGGQHFVVRVASFTPAKTQPFEEASASLAKSVHAEMLARRLDEFVAKLRKAHDVKVYLVSGK